MMIVSVTSGSALNVAFTRVVVGGVSRIRYVVPDFQLGVELQLPRADHDIDPAVFAEGIEPVADRGSGDRGIEIGRDLCGG